MTPGIYITLQNDSEVYIKFSELQKWKKFASTYTAKDVKQIIVKCFSLNNSQFIKIVVKEDEIVGFEACYKAIRMSFGFYKHYVVIYIPGKNPDYCIMINENARLLSTPKILTERRKLFYLKDE